MLASAVTQRPPTCGPPLEQTCTGPPPPFDSAAEASTSAADTEPSGQGSSSVAGELLRGHRWSRMRAACYEIRAVHHLSI